MMRLLLFVIALLPAPGFAQAVSYAGKTVTLFFGVFDNGYDKTHLDWYVSDIALQ